MIKFEDLEATYSVGKVGVLNDRFLAGSIGRPLMKPFTTTASRSCEPVARVGACHYPRVFDAAASRELGNDISARNMSPIFVRSGSLIQC
jgi:hypothetical protein